MQSKAQLNLALHGKVNNGDCYTVVNLLQQGADNDRDVAGDTPLMEAVWIGVPELVELLIEHGADLSAVNRDGKDIVEIAREGANEMKHSEGHQEVLRILQKIAL
jgi:ankyrin repeat protein